MNSQYLFGMSEGVDCRGGFFSPREEAVTRTPTLTGVFVKCLKCGEG